MNTTAVGIVPAPPWAEAEAAVTPTEEVLWKIVRAATALKSAAEHWQQCQRRSPSLQRHIRRCSVVAPTLQKASSYASTLGGAGKLAGAVTTAVGVLSRAPSLTGLGCRLWKAGCTAKLAGLSGKVLAEIWERGFKDTLTTYLSHLNGFLQSMTLFRAVLEEVEIMMPAEVLPGRFMPLLLLVCPEELFAYASHVVKLFVSPQQYSALYDFTTMALTSFDCSSSLPLKVMYEFESYHMLSVLDTLPKPLQLAASVLHVGKELMDFANGLRDLRNEDFHHVRKLLNKLRSSSVSLFACVKGGSLSPRGSGSSVDVPTESGVDN